MCGVLAGGVATWNTALDGAFGFQQLIDPSVQVTGITSPQANLQGAETAAAAAQATAQGKARLALSAAPGDDPALNPDQMNTAAAALGPNYNIFVSGGKVVPVAPAFTAFQPSLYLRPFDLGFRLRA